MPLESTDLILVCLVPSPRDLEIARLLGWYRIPLRAAPKVITVDHLAFYQASSFGDAGGKIEYTAAVRGHELTRRSDLLKDEAEHPRAREEYYKIQIGGLERLSQPIVAARWKRLTFLYTTGEYMLQARTLNDLVVAADARVVLWRSLRERAESEPSYLTDLPAADIPADVLIGLLGLRDDKAEYDDAELD